MTGDRFLSRHLAAILGFALAAGVANAQTAAAPAAPATAAASATAAKPLWKELSAPQQLALAPLLAEWDMMDSARKQKWLEIANRFGSMKPDEQQRAHGRMREWLKLTPEERRLARENYTLSKKIGKDQKSAQWEQYQQLPEEEKRKLAADAALKKHSTPLPAKTATKAAAPLKPVVCPAGQVKNTNPSGPACLPAVVPAPPLAVPPVTTPPPANPAVPVPNAK